MLNFKNLDNELIDIFDSLFDKRISKNAGNSPANLFAYNFIYPCEYLFEQDTLIIRIHLQNDSCLCYYEPIGKKTIKDYLPLIEQDAKDNSYCFSFILENKENTDYLAQQGYKVEYSDNLSEYVYLRESLQNLTGKKLQAKRNHINKFVSLYPSWEFVALNKEDKQKCLELTDTWFQQEMNISPQFKQDYQTEKKVIEYLFDNFEKLHLFAGAIFVGGQPVAYSIGSFVCKDTFDTNIEKADRRFEGAYTLINREIAKHLPNEIIYINREEDKGIEGLRKAKHSYHPIFMVEKYMVYKYE